MVEGKWTNAGRRDLKGRAFKDACMFTLVVLGKNILVHILNDIITIVWSPQEKDEYFDAEFQRSLHLFTDGKS